MAVRTLRQKSRFWTAVAAAALIALVVTAAVLVCLAPSVALAASGTADGDVVCIHIPISDEELLAGARPAPVSAEASPIFGDSFLLMSGCYYTATTVVEDDGTVSYELDYAGLKFYVYRSALADAAWILDPATADIPSDPSPALVLTPDGDSGVWNDADSWTLGDPADYTFEFIGYSDTVRTRVICSAEPENGSRTMLVSLPASAFEAFEVPLHPADEARLEALTESAAQPEQGGGNNIAPPDLGSRGIRIALIIGMAVPVLLVTCLLFKPSRAKGGDRKELARSSRGGSPVDYDRDRDYRDDRERFERGYRDYERRDYYRDDRGSRYDDRGGYPDDRR